MLFIYLILQELNSVLSLIDRKLCWGQVANRGMRSLLIVISSPGRNEYFRVMQITEPVFIQTLIPKFAVEALDVGILGRFSRLNQQRWDTVLVRPLIEDLAGKLRPLIGAHCIRISTELRHAIQQLGDIIAGQAVCRFD